MNEISTLPPTFLAVWIRTRDGVTKQFALWSTGEMVRRSSTDKTALSGEKWEHHQHFKLDRRKLLELDKQLRKAGYSTSYMTPTKALK